MSADSFASGDCIAEIEVTTAMAEAGAAILLDLYDEALSLTAPSVAIRVFEAMLAAQDAVSCGETLKP